MANVTGSGNFVDDFRKLSPRVDDTHLRAEDWAILKQQAKAAGMSVLDWLSETAFKGSQNPEGLGQQALAAVSHPFREANKLTVEHGLPKGTIPFWNYDPIGALLGVFAGGLGIPLNKYAKGEDVTKLDAIIGGTTLAGPVVSGVVKGTTSLAGNVAKRIPVPKVVDEAVDKTRRGLILAGTAGIIAPLTTAKLALKGGGQTVKGVALGATTIARNMASDSLVGLQALFKAADDMISGGGRYRPQAGGATIVDTVGNHSRQMIHSIGDVTTTRSALNPTKMSLDELSRSYLTFFGKFNRALKELDEGDTFVDFGRLGSNIDPKTNLPIMPDRLPPALDEALLNDDAFKLFSKEWEELAKAREAFERKWDLPTKGPKNYLNDYKPGPKFADDPIALRQFRDELNLITHNRQMAVQMQQWLDTLEIGMRHIEHLEITDPAKLRRVLQKVIADTRPGTGGGSGANATATREMAEDILEALK